MAQRTKRARMLHKLAYLLGPESEEYLISEKKPPYTFTKALNQTLAIFGCKYWGSGVEWNRAKNQLTKDFANLRKQISDEVLESRK